MKRAAVVGSFASFLMFGLLQSLYGPVLGWVGETYRVLLETAEMSASLNFLGALVGIIFFVCTRSWVGDRLRIALSLSLLGGGALLMSATTSWGVFLLANLLAGCGAGGIDYGLSIIFASSFGRRNVFMLNALHGMFGFGSVLGPILLGLFSPALYQVILLFVAVVVFLSLTGMRSLPRRRVVPIEPLHGAAVHARRGREVAVAAGFIMFFVLQVGVEFGIGIWEPQYLQSLAYTSSKASLMTSAFWLSLAVGRIVLGALGTRVGAGHLTVTCSIGATLSLCTVAVPSLAVIGYCLTGMFLGPLFPTGLGWISRTASADKLSGWCIGMSWLGGIIFPFMIGLGIAELGLPALPLGLIFLMAICTLTAVWLSLSGLRKERLPAELEWS